MLETDKLLQINNDLRTITVPPAVQHLGVFGEDNVHRLYFCMPRRYGDTDLADFVIKINFVNAAKQGDIYRVADAVTTENYIKFSWLIGRTVTAAAGKVQFSVCLKKYDENAVVLQEFNTVFTTLPVLEGLETTDLVIQQNPDVLEELRQATKHALKFTPQTLTPEQQAQARANIGALNATATINNGTLIVSAAIIENNILIIK